jgi:hypothetical protein
MDPQHTDWTALGSWVEAGMQLGLAGVVGWWLGGRVYALMCWFDRKTETQARARYQGACLTRIDRHLARMEMDRNGPGADVAILKVDLAMLRGSILEGRSSSR